MNKVSMQDSDKNVRVLEQPPELALNRTEPCLITVPRTPQFSLKSFHDAKITPILLGSLRAES